MIYKVVMFSIFCLCLIMLSLIGIQSPKKVSIASIHNTSEPHPTKEDRQPDDVIKSEHLVAIYNKDDEKLVKSIDRSSIKYEKAIEPSNDILSKDSARKNIEGQANDFDLIPNQNTNQQLTNKTQTEKSRDSCQSSRDELLNKLRQSQFYTEQGYWLSEQGIEETSDYYQYNMQQLQQLSNAGDVSAQYVLASKYLDEDRSKARH